MAEQSKIACPSCGQDKNKVTDTRGRQSRVAIRRRRKCLACRRLFTTYEIVLAGNSLTPETLSELLASLDALTTQALATGNKLKQLLQKEVQ